MVGFILPEGITGGAIFSEDGAYRQLLTRYTREDYRRILLWVGLNPSTAGATEDDQTVRIETAMTWRHRLRRDGKAYKYDAYAKVNVCDLVATNPQNMLASEHPRSDQNMRMLRRWAFNPKTIEIVLVFGALKPTVRHYMRETVELLKSARKPLLCVGTNADGSPKHPLYSPRDADLVPWKEILI